MSIAERKAREKAEREKHIMRTARQIATDQGWNAVTIRRLADEIEYSQPVIYAHFRNRDAIVAAVAVEGFGEIAAILRRATEAARNDRQALENVATAYIDFALGQSALYEAMLVLSSGLRFAQPDAPGELRDAFQALSGVVAPFCQETETATETLWAALHGAAELERHGRIRPTLRARRIEMIVQSLLTSGHAGPNA
ncbi:TetR/AcrR family transcriptional regulator [Massilia sp. 9096]|uniref:TetR/AcrR family transcriptional regulator n=1 Tax=Massilia sp. 9096 TaxID=1500894 RepID=UPI000564DDC9|nr:TetR/AcrR family transcriptional regulator [Massilia sp. 9096]